MPTDVLDVVEPGLHEWLAWMLDPDADLDHGPAEVPERLVTRCRAAVDPLEIAAALEVNGISHAVATDRYRRADVFSIAHSIWNRLAAEPVVVVDDDWSRRPGTWRDLARGVLHAVPVLVLLGVCHAFDTRLERWVLPVAISWGWGLGQATAHLAATARMRLAARPAAELRAQLLAVGGGSGLVLAALASIVRGTDPVSFTVAAALPLFMVATAIVLAAEREVTLARALVPGVLGAIVSVLPHGTGTLRWLVAALALATVVSVVVAAHRDDTPRPRGATAELLAAHHLRIAGVLLVHGLLVGAMASALVIDRRLRGLEGDVVLIVSLPLLATLGLMEWHLRTLRARLGDLADRHRTVTGFAAAARGQVVSTLFLYGAMVAIVAVAVGVVADPRGLDLWAFLGAQVLFGVACLADLCLVAYGSVRAAVAAWSCGVAVAAGWFVVDIRPTGAGWRDLEPLGGRVLDDVVWHGALVGTAVTVSALVLLLLRTAAATRHH